MSLFTLFNFIYESKYNENDFTIINKIPIPPKLEINKKGISFNILNIKYKYKNFNEYKNLIYKKNINQRANKSRRSRKKKKIKD